jgi:polysaccharide biosynthesis/export protein
MKLCRRSAMLQLAAAALCAQAPGQNVGSPSGGPPETAGAAADGYKLKVGDEIEFRLYYHSELNLSMAIRPDGKISFPLVGEVMAANQTPDGLSKEVSAGLARNGLRNTEATVIVRRFSEQRIYVGGEVLHPGVYNLQQPLTVMQAILQAGGLKVTARPSGALLIRAIDRNTPQLIDVNLQSKNLAAKAVAGGGLILQPLDMLYVPKSKIAKVNDFMQMYVKNLNPITAVFGLNYNMGAFTFRE